MQYTKKIIYYFYCNLLTPHIKGPTKMHKSCIRHSRDTTKCTLVYIQM